MSAIPTPPSAAAASPEAKRSPLPQIREDLRLYEAPSHRDGSPAWRIYDPVRNAFFEIGWLEFELLARWKEAAYADALIEQVADETQLEPTAEEVQAFVDFLANNQLLAPTSDIARKALSRRMSAAKKSALTQLLHHYLFFRLPLFRPDRFLAATVGMTDLFFTRGFMIAVLLLAGFDFYLLSREWYAFVDAMARMLTPAAFLYYAIAVTFAKVVHEFAHAYAAKRYGVRVPTMGVAFLVMWPYLYTDTGETWKLGDRHKQVVIASAGMAAELVLAVISTLLWAVAPEGAAKNVFFVLASTTWIMTLAINASPFMRFDGYFVLSDLLDFPNLHERSGACATWWLRRTFFGIEAEMPEPTLTRRQRAGLIAFAYVTWFYRLVVFLGIALLVYHLFFKLLGIFLMLVELVWFIFLPIWREVVALWKLRQQIHVRWRPIAAAAAVLVAFVWTVPISSQVNAPAVLRAAQEHSVYAPFGARVVALDVAERQSVGAAADLVKLEAIDLAVRDKKADIAIASARAEMARMPANWRLQENYRVTQEQLAQALAEKQAVAADYTRQQLRAPAAGTVRDIAPDLRVGRWVNQRQLLMRVVSEEEPLIEAYVDERQVEAIERGQLVRFYPDAAERRVITGEVLSVDKSPQKELGQPLLASLHGGQLMVKQSSRGSLVAQDAVFRVLIRPTDALPPVRSVVRGSVRIETDLRFVAENFVYRILSVLIRESGV